MNLSFSNYSALSHDQKMEVCADQHKSIGYSIQHGKAELIDQDSPEIVQRIQELAANQLIFCKQTIQNVKLLQLHTSDPSREQKLSENLVSLQERKSEILELKKSAEERLQLLQQRQALYGQEKLPTIPNFANKLRELSTNFPELTDGCDHFKCVAEKAMGLNHKRFLPKDLQKLLEFADQIEHHPEHAELFQAVCNLHRSLQDTTDRKTRLLNNLASWMDTEGVRNSSFDSWTPEQRIFFLSRADQIMNNPFEAKFDNENFILMLQEVSHPTSTINQLGTLLIQLWGETTRTSNKKDFWNYAPPFEQRCHQIADTKELQKYLLSCKLEGLKDIASMRHDDSGKQHLIVGAGPSGLIHAVTKKMQGLDCKIIEKRGEAKAPRGNTITFGKGDPKDLEILFFLGVLAKFTHDKTISFGHNKPELVEIKIGDVEEGLIHVLEELQGYNPIDYQTEVTAIETNGQGRASVSLLNTLTGETSTHLPATVTITDGFSGNTKKLLGVSRIDLAKPTMIAFSLFKNISEQEISTKKTLKYRIGNALKGIIFMLSIATYKVVKNKSLEESFAKTIKGGPSAIFRLPDQDYLIRVFRKQEQKVLADQRKKIKTLDRKIAVLKSKPETAHNTHKERMLQAERDQIDELIQTRLHRHAGKMHGMLDFFQGLYNPTGHQMRKGPMESTTDFLVDVQVGKAERNVVVVGSTPFLIRGDASHSTDPYSGYGCKTALEEIQADQNFYNTSMTEEPNSFELSMLSWGHEYYQQRMINMGLRERHLYRKRTETLTRFTDRAVTNESVTQSEGGRLLRLSEIAAQSNENPLLAISRSDMEFASNLQNRLQTQLMESLNNRSFDPNGSQKIKDCFKLKMTRSEANLLRQALRQALEDPQSIDSLDLKKLDVLCAKLTFHDIPEGWMLPLIFQCSKVIDS